jgi:Protein of unknown function (DUF2924)
MRKINIDHNVIGHLTNLSIKELRQEWASVWGLQPNARIGRSMLEKSLAYKKSEQGLTSDQQKRLDQLIKQYKRNPNCFDENVPVLKPGTRLVRNWNGTRHSVLVQTTGYEYKGKIYSSLSQIASEITGTRWNGLVFFGLKKKEAK